MQLLICHCYGFCLPRRSGSKVISRKPVSYTNNALLPSFHFMHLILLFLDSITAFPLLPQLQRLLLSFSVFYVAHLFIVVLLWFNLFQLRSPSNRGCNHFYSSTAHPPSHRTFCPSVLVDHALFSGM